MQRFGCPICAPRTLSTMPDMCFFSVRYCNLYLNATGAKMNHKLVISIDARTAMITQAHYALRKQDQDDMSDL